MYRRACFKMTRPSGEYLIITLLTLLQTNVLTARSSVSLTIRVMPYENGFPSNCAVKDSVSLRKCGVIPDVNTENLEANVAGFGEFPWQVAIIDVYDELFLCSGALISSRFVLTATSCVGKMLVTEIRVRVGEWDILNEKQVLEPYGTEDIGVQKKYIYVTDDWLRNDLDSIAILKLKRAAKFDLYPQVSPVCLPDRSQDLSRLTNCYIAGWGAAPINISKEAGTREVSPESAVVEDCDELRGECHLKVTDRELNIPESPFDALSAWFDDHLESRMLSKAEVYIKTPIECLQKLNGTIDVKFTQLCAFPEDDAQLCKFDVGSPIVCQMDELQMVERLTSAFHYFKDSKLLSHILKKDLKFMQSNKIPQYVLVGIVSDVHDCSSNPATPLVAINVAKSMDVICRLAAL